MVAPFLIFAVGNESRGDDALGPLLLRDLASWLMTIGFSEQFELIEEFQLQIEHALDMKGRQLVLFIDAGINTRTPFNFYRAQPCESPVLYSHALAPEALLKVYTKFYQEEPPAVFILCIAGEHFELGESLSAKASKRLAITLEFSKKLLHQPNTSHWELLLTR
ncbi:hydrogenase maturation protease [Methylotenera sp.]|jgi:hydrogenase maturation protease|uniref:hydrogenase maturation protease n=1 Tax=Methylotenera sp. TaxID=2051956 RepID=UPI002730CDE5|nr:hydrogenase maturation protease [Methylotenera sp.]MDP3006939.1 hydrogenase maturation protease [Methylotenera sp.]MDP3007124.1 hydrogenase maturation protease [Methylotenera sp.]